jgi:hypothetical protein
LRVMAARAAIVHLIGYPAAGKYTVARHLAAAADREGQRIVVVDNHHTANVIFTVMDVDGVRPLPAGVWDRVGEVREAVYQAIEEFSPPEWSFVFTNVLSADVPSDELIVSRLQRLAAQRSNPYVPIVLHCDPDEILRRVGNEERRARQKWIDQDAVRAFIDDHALIGLEDCEPLELDMNSLRPAQAATKILHHLRSF